MYAEQVKFYDEEDVHDVETFTRWADFSENIRHYVRH